MPLIRYEIGDVGRWAEQQSCPCGRGLPLLAEVNGRTTDFLVLKDGRRVSGPALTLVVADMSVVAQVQFHQHHLNRIVLKVVPGKNFGPQRADYLGNIGKVISHVRVEGTFGLQGMLWP